MAKKSAPESEKNIPNAGASISEEQLLRLLGTSPNKLKLAARWGYIPRVYAKSYPLAPTINGFCKFLASDEITIEEAGQILGVSIQWVRKLVAEGYIKQNERGNLTKNEVFNGWVRWSKDETRRTSKTSSATELQQERKRQIALKTARDEGELVPIEEAQAFNQAIVGALIARLNGLPAQLTRNQDERKKFEAAIDGIRDEMAKSLSEYEGAYQGLESPDPADEEDAA